MKKVVLKIFRIDMFVLSLFWLGMGISYAVSQGLNGAQYIIIAVLMIINAVLFAFFAVIYTGKRLFFRIIIFLFILVNTILTFTDQFGLLDYIALLFNIVALGSSVALFFRQT